jgi:hypothetical protein
MPFGGILGRICSRWREAHNGKDYKMMELRMFIANVMLEKTG